MRLPKALWFVSAAVIFYASAAAAQGATADAGKTGAAAGASTAADAKPADKPAATGKAADKDKPADPAAAAPAGSAAPAAAGSAAPAAAGTTAAGASAPDQQMDGSTYVVRLRDLEQRVDELKEQIRRSHTRLSLLSDTILSGGVGGARAEIKFTNDMSSAFRLTRALFVLDGAVQYNKQDDTGTLAAQKEIPIFSGSIPPGDHTLQVLVQLNGYGYGVFSYLRGYHFEVKSSHSFTVTEGKTVQLDAIAWEKGGVTTPLEQRPAVRYVEKLRSGVAAEGGQATPSSSGSGVSGGISIGTGGN